ncbi:glycosyltransferase family 4 protein [Vibrio fluvialis]|nr:glycosyltransferase family 4 protein [Vibrio fluvialis]
MSKKRVLVLAEYIGENHNSTAYYWSQIVKSLQDKFDVILLTPDSNHAREFSDKYNVPTKYVEFVMYNKNKLFSRLIGQIRQTIYFLRSFYREVKSVDLVFSGTNPIFTMFAMTFIKKIKSFKWLVLVHDVFPNNLVPGKVLKPERLFYRVLNYFSVLVYSTPEHMICIGRDMRRLLGDKINMDDRLSVIPNWASTEVVKPESKRDNDILLGLGWVDNVVFQFFGNMGRLQGIDNLLKSVELVKNKESRFLFIGNGSESQKVKQKAASINAVRGYEYIHYYGSLSLDNNNVGLNACDISLVTLSSDMFGLGVPSKAYFSMAADKPILYVGDKGSELELLLSEHNLGWFCEGSDPVKLAALIDNITEKFSEVSSQYYFKPRNTLESHFSEKMALDEISKLVKEL